MGKSSPSECNDARSPAASPLDALIQAMRDVVDALYDTAVLQRPESYAIVSKPTRKQVVPGTPIQLMKNGLRFPVQVIFQAQPTVSALPGYLIASSDAGECSLERGFTEFATGPKMSWTVLPNQAIFVDITHPDGLATALNVQFTVVPLRGKTAVFSEGV